MEKSTLVGIGIVVLTFLIVGFLYVRGNVSSGINGNAINPEGNSYNDAVKTQNCHDVQVPYDDIEYYTDTEPYTDKECETKNLAYKIENFNTGQNVCTTTHDKCNNYFLGVCTDKTPYCAERTVSYSLDLTNLDNEERTQWTLHFNIIENGNPNKVFKSEDQSKAIYPQSSEKFTISTTITSDTVDGDATKEVGANYLVTYTPTKQVCHDVIKYRDVQKSRTITKYKTEQKCD